MDDRTNETDIGTSATALHERSTAGLDLAMLPARLDDAMLAEVRAIADAPLPCLPICDDTHLAKCLRAMLAVLPRQKADEMSGELFVRTYQRQLGGYPKEAISFLAQRATLRHEWFPTIKQCVDILNGWQRSDQAAHDQMIASAAYRREMQARMEEAMTAMREGSFSQREIDALPERLRRIAVERGHLRRHGDGTYSLRRKPQDDEKAKAA